MRHVRLEQDGDAKVEVPLNIISNNIIVVPNKLPDGQYTSLRIDYIVEEVDETELLT